MPMPSRLPAKLLRKISKTGSRGKIILLLSLSLLALAIFDIAAIRSKHIVSNKAAETDLPAVRAPAINNLFEDYVVFKDLGIGKPISSLKISGQVALSNPASFLRVVLLDDKNMEYLIYETYPLIAGRILFNVKDACEETCQLENLTPLKLRIEGRASAINKLKIDTGPDEMPKDTLSAQITAIKTAVDREKIEKINASISKKKLRWTAGETPVSRMTYMQKKGLFSREDGTALDHLPNLFGFEFYKGGIFEIPRQTADTEPSSGALADSPLPSSWDWRSAHGENWNSPVKNQGTCGSCWAFTAVGAVEAATNLYYNQHLDIDLSEQELVSCANNTICSGGDPIRGLDYIKQTGIASENCMPYQGVDGVACQKCPGWSSETVRITDWNNEKIMPDWVTVTTAEWLKYKIVNNGPLAAGYAPWSHAMVLSGWETDPGDRKTVWIFKNSWGSDWGDNGYAKIKTDTDMIGMAVKVLPPVTVANQTINIACNDKDGDGYCNWGINPTKPGVCALPCKPEKDCDDSNSQIAGEAYCNQELTPTPTPTALPTFPPKKLQFHVRVSNRENNEIINGLAMKIYGRLNMRDEWHLLANKIQDIQPVEYETYASDNDFAFEIVDGDNISYARNDMDYQEPNATQMKCQIIQKNRIECPNVRQLTTGNMFYGLIVDGYTLARGDCQCDIGQPVTDNCASSFSPFCIDKFTCQCQQRGTCRCTAGYPSENVCAEPYRPACTDETACLCR